MLALPRRPMMAAASVKRQIAAGAGSRLASTDAISELYVTQIRDIFGKVKASGSLTNSSAEVKKQLDEQLNRLAQKHGILSADQIAKLSFKPQPPVVSSSVAALVEGKPVSQLMTEMEVSRKAYEIEHTALVKEEQRKAALASGADTAVQEMPDCCKDDPVDAKYWYP